MSFLTDMSKARVKMARAFKPTGINPKRVTVEAIYLEDDGSVYVTAEDDEGKTFLVVDFNLKKKAWTPKLKSKIESLFLGSLFLAVRGR